MILVTTGVGVAYEELGDRLIAKGTLQDPMDFPVADGPPNKYSALFDRRPAFDMLRKSFLITGSREKQQQIIQIILECRDRGCLADGGVVTDLCRILLDDVCNLNPVSKPFEGFDAVAIRCFASACQDPGYYLSVDELLFLADIVNENVVIMELRDGRAAFAGASRGVGSTRAERLVAIVGLDSSRRGRVRSHFSRMVMEPDAIGPGGASSTGASAATLAAAAQVSAAATGEPGRGDEFPSCVAESLPFPSQQGFLPATGFFNAGLEQEAMDRLSAWEVARYADHSGTLMVITQSEKDEQLAKIRAELLSSPKAFASAKDLPAGRVLGSASPPSAAASVLSDSAAELMPGGSAGARLQAKRGSCLALFAGHPVMS